MAHGYKNGYLEWLIERAWNDADRSGTFEILLYDEQADTLGDDAGVGDIETEPDGLGRVEFSFGEADVFRTGNGANAEFGDAVFDLDGVDGEVDSFGIVGEFEVDGSVQELLVGVGPISERTDLADYSGEWPVPVGASFTSLY